ncbi:reverse transcriptase domain-containing protein [Tanacetum coccineum]
MTGVPRHMAEHRLNVREGCFLVRQKKRGQAPERNKAICEEVEKLVNDSIMKEVHYHSWLSNPVMVKKHDNCWRMCVDFKDLNKGCPKDGYPLSKIDWKVESLCGYPFKCFLDAYKGYHQIKMAKEDEEKTAFITSQGIFCYSKMPFGLKIFGATYQRLVDKAFQKQIGQNLKAYVDDLVIKKAETAFQQMKKSIAELLDWPGAQEKEELIIYLAATKEAISVVLMTERDGKQIPIYFVNRALQGPEINYTPMEKLVLALDNLEDTLMEDVEELPDPWTLFTDGSSCADGSGAGLILTNPEGMEFTYALRFRFDAKNNKAEYEALIAGLKIAEQMGVENLQANVDSRLVSRSKNKKADALSKIASTSFTHLSKQVLVEELKKKSINAAEVLAVVEEEGDTWMTPIFRYLSDGTLPAKGEKSKSNKTQVVAVLHNKRDTIQKIFPRTMATLRRTTLGQLFHKPVPRNPQQKLSPITSPWPFYKWGIDIAGHFPEGPKKVKFLIVAIDYFTKWIEAKPVATITGSQIKKFMWDNIVCRFRLPEEIILDNGKQFQDNPFKDWCENLCIRQHFASVKHPQTNGLVERENRSLGEGIKARLDERSKNWMGGLPRVLWAHRTMIKSSNGDTPFSLTYGTEAVISAETGMPTLRTAEVNLEENKEALEINLDLLEERREQAAIREAKSKAKMERYYNSKI